MPTGLTKPTNNVTFNSLKTLLKCKMVAHYAYGTLLPASKPATMTALTALLAECQPMGDLAKEGVKVNWKRESIPLLLGQTRGQLTLEGTIPSVTNTTAVRNNLDEDASGDPVTIILVPVNNPATPTVLAPAKCVILPGVYLVDSGALNGDDSYGGVTFSINSNPNKLADAIWEITLTS